MFDVEHISFDTSGLILRQSEQRKKLWLNGYNDILELRAFPTKPDIPVLLSNKQALLEYYQRAAKTQNAVVLDLAVQQVASIRAVYLTMFAPAKPKGHTYVSSLALPFRDGSFVLKIQALETIARDDLSSKSDALYPAHGLTRTRAEIQRLANSITLEAKLQKAAKFQAGLFGILR
ncbi:MAG: hypothetical protein ACK41E_01970 [Deinococcales bacterium]